jgi:CHASE1-domain containing sensor protein
MQRQSLHGNEAGMISPQPLNIQIRRTWLPYTILAGMVLLTLLATYYAFVTSRVRNQLRFEGLAQ